MISTFTPDLATDLATEAGGGRLQEVGPAPLAAELARVSAHAPPAASLETPAPIVCPHCGGSGILRMGDQQFRTCLECLGQGQLSRTVQQELLFPSLALRVSAGRAG